MTAERTVPYVDLAARDAPLADDLAVAVRRVLEHGQYVLGPEVRQFEEAFASLCQVKYAVGVGSGTDALALILRCLGVGEGDEVVTVPNSFLATASAIALNGARPVFVDVRDDLNMDPGKLAEAITPRTRAILPVHLTGRPADMDAIRTVARAHSVPVIEDAAQAVAARYRGRSVGSFGLAGAFSLHPLKNLGGAGAAPATGAW
jgi:dTDP-4-amino-4,6-dideoxygalactose transaminase